MLPAAGFVHYTGLINTITLAAGRLTQEQRLGRACCLHLRRHIIGISFYFETHRVTSKDEAAATCEHSDGISMGLDDL